MKVGPKYKLARKLGAAVFEKTQTAKFALRQERKTKNAKRTRPKSNYGIELIETQRVRFTYGITAKQLGNYAKKSIDSKSKDQSGFLYQSLELRADSVVLKSGIATTRYQARQIVSHGHMCINGKRINVPSYAMKIGDVLTIRDASKNKTIFSEVSTKMKEVTVADWLSVDAEKVSVTVKGAPNYKAGESAFDLALVLQFYKR
jgi:small subunit ribosomal protein S4